MSRWMVTLLLAMLVAAIGLAIDMLMPWLAQRAVYKKGQRPVLDTVDEFGWSVWRLSQPDGGALLPVSPKPALRSQAETIVRNEPVKSGILLRSPDGLYVPLEQYRSASRQEEYLEP